MLDNPALVASYSLVLIRGLGLYNPRGAGRGVLQGLCYAPLVPLDATDRALLQKTYLQPLGTEVS